MNHHAVTHPSSINTQQSSANAPRLPCRGCTRSCKSYDRCDGKPWKLTPSAAPSMPV